MNEPQVLSFLKKSFIHLVDSSSGAISLKFLFYLLTVNSSKAQQWPIDHIKLNLLNWLQ